MTAQKNKCKINSNIIEQKPIIYNIFWLFDNSTWERAQNLAKSRAWGWNRFTHLTRVYFVIAGSVTNLKAIPKILNIFKII